MSYLDNTGVATLAAKLAVKVQAAIQAAAVDFTGATSSAAGAHGLVPAPASSDDGKFLKGSGSWEALTASDIGSGTFAEGRLPEATTSTKGGVIIGSGLSVSSGTISVPDMTGATSSVGGAHGLVPQPSVGDETKFLCGNGLWETVSTGSIPDMTGATSSAAGTHGLVPAPSAGDQEKLLRGDGTWTNGYVASFNGSTGAITYTETDPTVPSWAKASSKPSYTASEVGALPDTTSYVSSFNGSSGAITYTAPVTSVNGSTGDVVIGDFTSASGPGVDGTHGLVPAPTASDYTHYLNGKNGWAAISAGHITTGVLPAAQLPEATTSTKGGVIVGSGLSVSNGTISVTDMTGATSSTTGAHGLVPAPAIGDQNKFLRGDGTWQTAGGASDVSITRYSVTLNPSTWTYNSTNGWYEETVSVYGFTYVNTIKNIEIDINLNNINKAGALQIQEDWALVGRIYVDSNGLHAICYNDPPTYSIPLLMCVMITGE